MKAIVLSHLQTGHQQLLAAQAAGVAHLAVADAYSAVDNFFSAALLQHGHVPDRNHKKKLEVFLGAFGPLVARSGIEKADVTAFYRLWLDCRYSRVAVQPGQAVQLLRLARDTTNAILQDIAEAEGITVEKLQDQLYTAVLGSRWTAFDEVVSEVHEQWQQQAEYYGEQGIGSKLSNKILNPSNFADVRAFADDPITQEIIAQDADVGRAVGDLYHRFLRIVVSLQLGRMARGVPREQVTDFMFSLRFRYHGQSEEEIARDWGQMIARALHRLSSRDGFTTDSEEESDR